QGALVATGAFTSVGIFDATFSTPTLGFLQGYQAVLVYSISSFANPVAVGDLLADYFDAGGRVVLAPAGNCSDPGLGLEGRVITDGYAVGVPGPLGCAFLPDSLGRVFEPQSALMAGVSSLSAQLPIRCFLSP